jgi:hypothetical protein
MAPGFRGYQITATMSALGQKQTSRKYTQQEQESERSGGDAGSEGGLGALRREVECDRWISSKVQSEAW